MVDGIRTVKTPPFLYPICERVVMVRWYAGVTV